MRRALLVTLSLLAMAAQPAWADIGRVKKSAGVASIERKGAKINPAIGTTLLPGDVLVTGQGGQIAITFADNTRFSVGPIAVLPSTSSISTARRAVESSRPGSSAVRWAWCQDRLPSRGATP